VAKTKLVLDCRLAFEETNVLQIFSRPPAPIEAQRDNGALSETGSLSKRGARASIRLRHQLKRVSPMHQRDMSVAPHRTLR
jgi:hypothetical protein